LIEGPEQKNHAITQLLRAIEWVLTEEGRRRGCGRWQRERGDGGLVSEHLDGPVAPAKGRGLQSRIEEIEERLGH
jgi:hypothetical protein